MIIIQLVAHVLQVFVIINAFVFTSANLPLQLVDLRLQIGNFPLQLADLRLRIGDCFPSPRLPRRSHPRVAD